MYNEILYLQLLIKIVNFSFEYVSQIFSPKQTISNLCVMNKSYGG